MSTAIFTIVSRNYLSYARVLASSIKKYHPNTKIYVLLVDKNVGIDVKQENFELFEIERLKIKNIKTLLFKYNILELSTAVKPFFIEYLFKELRFNNVIYFDPDILIVNKINHVFSILSRYSIVLTPHITKPLMDGLEPDEIDFLKTGAFNLGFIALRNTKVARDFVDWWKDRLYSYCLCETDKGLFVDQKWADLIPNLFPDYFILREPGYNVAYWNLHERSLSIKKSLEKNITVNSQPLYFFHFSGFVPEKIDYVSIHQNRFSLRNITGLKPLFEEYRALLYRNDYGHTKRFKYAYGTFENGVEINDFIRKIYFSFDDKKKKYFGDPFSVDNKSSFYNWLVSPRKITSPGSPFISNLFYEIYKSRKDLQAVFPNVFGNNLEGFLNWIISNGRYEYGLDKRLVFIHRKNESEDRYNKTGIGELFNRFLYHPTVQKRKYFIKRMVGSSRYYTLRNLFISFSWKLNTEKIKKQIKTEKIKMSGVNFVGHVTAESGTGQASRGLIKSIKTADVPMEITNLEMNLYRKDDKTFTDFSSLHHHPINIVSVNADQSDAVYKYLGRKFFEGKYNIGYWLWEQSSFPNDWFDRYKYFDEIWTSSSFAASSVGMASPIPVIRIPLSVAVFPNSRFDRDYFSLPKDKFIFLFIFDFLSIFERKNPIAVVNAFQNSFSNNDSVLLLLKTVNSKYNPSMYSFMKSSIKNNNVVILDKYLSKDEVDSLINVCDSYVSLHRSEGFGYTIFEAMLLGKPVVATSYSGNMDIMNSSNSYLVKYKLTELGKNYGPYKKGTVWAEPEIEHASKLMRTVFNKRG